jgi:hypothetical protein
MTPRLVRAAALTAAAVIAGALGLTMASTAAESDALEPVRSETGRYRNVDAAIRDGYVQFFGCVHEPLAGGMGIHFVNAALVADPTIDAAKPEALMYESTAHGYRFLGVEYVVFKADWDKTHDAPPTLYGKTFQTVEAPNRYGIPTFYELHAWTTKTNPNGPHADWNPTVLCPTTEGHTH